MDVELVGQYRCLWCGTYLRTDQVARSNTKLHCELCGRAYPVLQGIPILTLRPNSLLTAWYKKLIETSSRLRGVALAIQRSQLELTHVDSATRARRAQAGVVANLNLFDATRDALTEYLQAEGQQNMDVLDYLPNSTDWWSPDCMLPYFVQDWVGSPDFARVKSLVIEALTRSCSDADAVAVLGAGACGLVQAVAETNFTRVYGADLSVPVMMLASRLLSGGSLVVHLAEASWRPVKLNALESKVRKIELVIADVHALPFSDSSLSAVVTQYLIEIIGNPLSMIHEIRRVLKPGGVWIYYSWPFRDQAESKDLGPLTPAELVPHMKRLGFEITDNQTENFKFLNLEQIEPNAGQARHRVQSFVARKLPDKVGEAHTHAAMGHYWCEDDRWWNTVPQFALGRRAQVTYTSGFGTDGSTSSTDIKFFMDHAFPIATISVPEEDAIRLKVLLNLIDGKQNNRQIYCRYSARGFSIGTTHFRELMYYLTYQHGLLRMSAFPQGESATIRCAPQVWSAPPTG